MQKRRKLRVNWFRLIIVVMAGYFIYSGVNQYNQLHAINREQEAVRVRLEQAREMNAGLLEERRRLNDRNYIEKLAREELGLVKPGEILYIPAEKN